MSKIEEALLKASELREFAIKDKNKPLGVYKKNRWENKRLYIPIVTVMAVLSVIMSFVLFINTNIASQRPTHVVTKKGETDSQKIEQYINKAITDNQNVYHTIHTIQIGSFIKIERAQKQLDFIAQRLDEKKLDYLRIEKIGKFYSIRLGKFEDPFDAEKFLQSIKPHLPTAITMKANIKDERIIRLYKDSSSSVSSTHQTFIE